MRLPNVFAQDDADDEKIAAGWIDAHSHVWSPDTTRWPLEAGQTAADLKPPSFTPEELLAVAGPEGVTRVVLIQHHIYHGFDNAYLIDCARRFPKRFVVTGMIDDRIAAPGALLKELAESRVRALRITSLIRPRTWLEGPGMADLWKTGAETGQPMCLLINPGDLPAADAMCQKHPDTPVVVDHFARIGVDGQIRDAEVKQLCRLARHARTHVKISAYYALGRKAPPYDDLVPMIRSVLDAFGVERVMWASDCPYQVDEGHTYADSIGLVRDRLDFLSDGDRQWLLRKTAEKVYFS
jgi:predicted TIM-barrel fold metal-dependent hydrolase